MGSKHRPQREFVDGQNRKKQFRAETVSPEQLKPQHFDLRVRRPLDVESTIAQTVTSRDWENYIADVVKANPAIGNGLSLASVSITMITATEMNNMLRDANPKHFFDPASKLKLFRETSRKISDFIEKVGREEKEFKNSLEVDRLVIPDSPDELFADLDYVEGQSYDEAVQETVRKQQQSEHKFGSFTLHASGIRLMSNGIALDFRDDKRLEEDRESLIAHLHQDQKLDTRYVNPNWEAHAKIFRALDHVTASVVRTPPFEDRGLDVVIFDPPKCFRHPE